MRAALALVLLSCGHKDIVEDRYVQHDVGVLCLGTTTSDASAGDLTPNEPLQVVVRSAGCLDSCTRERSAKCSVKREGDKVIVSSEIAYRAPTEIGKPCKGDCTVLEASCSAPALGPGTYEVVLGETRSKIEVPSRIAPACIQGGPRVVPTAAPSVAPVLPALPASVIAEQAAPPPTAGPVPPPPGDGFCVAPFGTATKKSGALAVTLTRPNPCIGASCAMVKPKCSLTKAKGNRIVVKTDLPVADKAKPRKPCTDDCPGMLASCKLEGLPFGAYTVEWNETKEPVTVPMAKEICLP